MSDPTAVAYPDILKARDVLKGQTIVSHCEQSHTLSSILGCDVFLKCENLQFTSSFKERGAFNRLAALSTTERKSGIIAMSAGNHALGVAYHAGRMGVPTTIVVPLGTPTIKVENTRRFGAEVIVHGSTLEEASDYAHTRAQNLGLTFIHPYDDPLVIAGQGTIACEMLEQVHNLDVIVVPIGGGGLAAGVAIAAKALRPQIRIVGIQASLYPSMYNVIKGTALPNHGDTLAEGIAVKTPGILTQRIIRQLVDDIQLVDEVMLERAVSILINIEKTVVEGAGAAGLAAILASPQRFAKQRVATVLCGGNIDMRLLASVLTRDLARDGRLSRLAIDLVDQPGRLAEVTRLLGEQRANIVEVAHQRVFTDLPAKAALLDVVIETRDRRHRNETIAVLRHAGFHVVCEVPESAENLDEN
ncbi:MAG: threonine ammonia-lyase [Hyphomicrobiaceae bacterium]